MMNVVELYFQKRKIQENPQLFQLTQAIAEQANTPSKEVKPTQNVNKIKEYILNWCSYSTAHGISNISRVESRPVLFLWICFYLYNALINMEFQNDPPVDFPAVTVCNLNPFDKRFAKNYIDKVLNVSNISYVHDVSLIDIEPATVYDLIKSAFASDKTLNDTDRSSFGFSLDYMMLKCQFNGYLCNQSEMLRTYNFDYGNCYTFNSGYNSSGNKIPIKQISQAGSDKSFQLELFLGDESVQSEFLLNSGARVIVHNQSVTPIYQSEGRDVASGYLTNIGITRSFFTKLSQPYSDCVKETSKPDSYDSNYYRDMFNVLNMRLYRQKNCLPLCLQAYLNDECGCLDGALPNIYKTYSICNNLTSLKCVDQKSHDYFNNDSLQLKCYKECPLECDSSSYSQSSSTSRYPSIYYTQYLKSRLNITNKLIPLDANANETANILKYNINDNNITKNIVFINVFYDDLTTTYIKEIPEINGDQLLGNIGGNLALFAGMSALSFVEIIELIIEIILIKIKE